MTRALVTQLLNALEHHQSQTRPIHNTEFAIAEAREYLATEPKQRDHPEEHLDMVGDRAELIRQLRDVLGKSVHVDIANEAADMLEADAQPKDKGPWCAGMTKDARVYVQSDDFKRDARLYVNGDFATKNEEYLYACALARHLNATAETMSANSQQAKQVPKND